MPIVDNHKWRNLLFMVKIEDLQAYSELHFSYKYGQQTDSMRDMRSNRPCKCIILSMRHIAPPILYYEAPMSFMTENSAKKFYDGVDTPEDKVKVHDDDDGEVHDLD